ncbi:MAG TPA: inosine/xanthosine triphosphatase, partial [Candidatus Absconditabacterales bacterium]|nr:inosine/xanthosine triphosphatase [Candidatus Absconditabacterales bacterium]
VEKAFQDCPYFGGKIIKYESRKTSSDVSDMPLSIKEIMQGAKNRVKNLQKEIPSADFYVGLEGGTSKIGDKYFLFGVTYIENQKGIGHYGFSPMMEIPNQIQKELYDHKKDLGVIIEEMSDRNDIKSNNGTLGELSDDMIKRAESFQISTQAAIAPFFNKYWK